jgi:signal transduction histidine kinase
MVAAAAAAYFDKGRAERYSRPRLSRLDSVIPSFRWTTMASLLVIQGRDQGKRFELFEDVAIVGRVAGNTIQLRDSEVSRRHAEFRREDDVFILRDLHSSNGTFVNNKRIEQQPLKNGDRVQLGRSLLVFSDSDDRSSHVIDDVDILRADHPDGSRIVRAMGNASGSASPVTRPMPMAPAASTATPPPSPPPTGTVTSGILEPSGTLGSGTLTPVQLGAGESPATRFAPMGDVSTTPAIGASVTTAAVTAVTAATATARRDRDLRVMYETAMAVSQTLEIDALLQRILELIFEWVEADRGCVMLLNAETNQLEPKARRDRKRSRGDGKMAISRTILDYVLQRKEGVVTSDAREDNRWDAAGSIVTSRVREAICVPMQGRYGIVGVIYIDTYRPPELFAERPVSRFTEDHLQLMVAIGRQAALAVEDTAFYSAMVQAERLAAVGQTIATLSHHIKNILQGIRGGSYLIDEGLKAAQTETIRKGWRIVERNQERISSLVMDMLTLSKERDPELAPARIQDVVQDVVELMQTRARDANVSLHWSAGPPIAPLVFDADGLHRAILNVVTNAIDACDRRADGAVRVAVEHDLATGQLRIEVADNGAGIENADLERIFNAFESRKGNRGTGLGLPVSRKILREHGGDIRVESQLGVGSRFTLELPAVLPAAGAEGGATLFDLPPRS